MCCVYRSPWLPKPSIPGLLLPCSGEFAPELNEAEVKAGFSLLDTNQDNQVGTILE